MALVSKEISLKTAPPRATEISEEESETGAPSSHPPKCLPSAEL
jgi:hypothetical protein